MMTSKSAHDELRLHTLPIEILLQLMPFLGVPSLRQFRLVCRALKDLPNSVLFRTFYLYPHKPSFEALLHLVESDAVRCHVRRLVYDVRWADLDDQIFAGIKRFNSTTRHFDELLNNLRFDTLIHKHDEAVVTAYLALAFCKLSALDDIVVFDLQHPFDKRQRDSCRFEQVPEYYQRSIQKIHGHPLTQLGNFRHATADGFKAAAVASCILEAAAQTGRSVSTLRLVGITSTDLAAQTTIREMPERYGACLAGIEDLRIDFGCIPRERERAALARLPVVLNQCTSLVDLCLEFGTMGRYFSDIDTAAPYIEVSLFDDMFPDTPLEQQRFVNSPLLRSLDLRGVRCTEFQFQHLFKDILGRSPGFQGFCAWDLTIVPETEDAPRSCLVRVVKHLRSLGLAGCRLSGMLSNRGMQQWTVITPPDLNMLCDKVHDYMNRMGNYAKEDVECPLEFAVIPEEGTDLVIPIEYNNEGSKWRGDSSWQMNPSGRTSRSDGWASRELFEYLQAGMV